jgi:histidinol-phosphate phosphatase family protein
MVKKRKAVFVDKDGTLVPDIPYNVDASLIRLEAGVAEGLRALQAAGYIIVIISNQSGIAHGYFTVEQFQGVQVKIRSLLADEGITLSGFYYCPHHPQGYCGCRKPKPGLILSAAKELQIELNGSWMIGDILNDVEAGRRAGCKTVLINNGNETEWLMNDSRTPDFTATNFKEAADHILSTWINCKNILCIRADNMGDVIMSSPAMRALKQSFDCRITLLTSSMGAGIGNYLAEIDEVITYDLPWVKTGKPFNPADFYAIVEQLRSCNFDAAVIFTVFSQNPLPAAMLAYLAGIPRRLAYCRENPYELLTHWVPDKEPYNFIRHQVERDLLLVQHTGATTSNDKLSLQVPAFKKSAGDQIVLHAPVSEQKRKYPLESWAAIGRLLIKELNCKLMLTGTASEKNYVDKLQSLIGPDAISMAGKLNLGEFIALINHAPLLISVNTGSVHIAAAVNTPVIVLYALTNPQHTPWKVPHKVFYFDVPPELQSKNEVLRFVNRQSTAPPDVNEIVAAAKELIRERNVDFGLKPDTANVDINSADDR